ncbi:hypothetical protein KY362_02165 [Candidatus Woesearchaeota archaeon]|nr:hypothetical protein [Candidatus Woesearchaeota archaeon]
MADSKKQGKLHIERYLIKFGRGCAWALVVMIILYFVSGFGLLKSGMIYNLTGGLLDRGRSLWIHEILTIPMAFAAICHTLIAIRFAMIRWKVKNMKAVDYSFIALGVVLFAAVCWAYLV